MFLRISTHKSLLATKGRIESFIKIDGGITYTAHEAEIPPPPPLFFLVFMLILGHVRVRLARQG